MNTGKRNRELYRELTPAGAGLCAVAGAVAEGITFIMFGIRIGSVPVPVLIFLWGLFGILVSGVLILADSVESRIQEIKEWVCWAKDRNVLAAAEAEYAPEQYMKEQIPRYVSSQVIYRDIWGVKSEVSSEERRKAS